MHVTDMFKIHVVETCMLVCMLKTCLKYHVHVGIYLYYIDRDNIVTRMHIMSFDALCKLYLLI